MPEATLISYGVNFHTTDDDKDSDTWFAVYWTAPDGRGIGSIGDLGKNETFANHTDRYFDIPVTGNLLKHEVAGSIITVRLLHTHGSDTWKFDLKVSAKFSDGTTKVQIFGGAVLTDEARDGVYPLTAA